MKRVLAIVSLLLIAIIAVTAGCINRPTGSVLPDTDDDGRTGIDEAGDEDGTPGFDRSGGDETNTGTNSDRTGTTGSEGTGTNTGISNETTGDTGNTTSTTTNENCSGYVCGGEAQSTSDYSLGPMPQ